MSIWREYLLLRGGVGMPLLGAEVMEPDAGGRGELVDGVYWMSRPPKESCRGRAC
jgi:hypothetical protein